MNRGILRRLRGKRPDEGFGLVLVIGTMLVIASLALVALAFTVNSKQFARYTQDYSSAMSAAQSGIEDFISHLNRDDQYGTSVDCLNDAWRGPDTGANSCGWGSTTPYSWKTVAPGDTDPSAPAFHYTVDATDAVSGAIALRVTGRSNGVFRTLETTVGKGGSTDYVYYTDFESADPDNKQVYPDGASAACGGGTDRTKWRYWWASATLPSRSGSNCVEIRFIGGDELVGEVFTNDTIYAVRDGGVDPSFTDQVYTADKRCDLAGGTTASWNTYCLRDTSSTDAANFNGKKPLYHDPFYLTDTSAMFADLPGCHYFGSTRIIFESTGKMKVWNDAAVYGAPTAKAPPGGSAPDCGDVAQLSSASGDEVEVPSEMVVYAETATTGIRQCYAGELGTVGGVKFPLGTFSSTTPAVGNNNGEYIADTTMGDLTKQCNRGNIYVEGVVKGRVTIAARESVVATGDIVLARGLSQNLDMVGLVATNSVEVFHPRMNKFTTERRYPDCAVSGGGGASQSYQYCPTGTEGEAGSGSYTSYGTWPTRYLDPGAGNVKNPTNGIQIAASIQSLLHSFWVQKYWTGSEKGDLLVNGSIAQRWRGIVGQGDGSDMTGYIKDYRYDIRLKLTAPPYFPKWLNAQWTLRYSGEVNTPSALRGS